MVETAFLEERIDHYQSFFESSPTNPVISDYSLSKSLLFAKQNLTAFDFKIYQKNFVDKTQTFLQPDLFVFLNQSIPRLQKNIEQRGRSFEQKIETSYLEKIAFGYQQWKDKNTLPLKEITLTDLDYVENHRDFLFLLAQIFRQ